MKGLTARHQRRTAGLRSLLERVALALAGRAGSRLARALGAVVSRFTLIRRANYHLLRKMALLN